MNQQREHRVTAPDQEWALASYLAAIRAHRVVVVLVMLATISASVAYLGLRTPTYEATADLLVEPVPQDDQNFLGLPLVRDTGDPTRTVQTAASLVESQAAAQLKASELGGEGAVEVNPEGESNILEVTATAESAEGAADIANEFARAALAARAEQLSRLARPLIERLEVQLEATPPEDAVTRAELTSRLEQVRSVLELGDPTLTLSLEAEPPTSPTGPSPALIVILATIAGFALGVGAAVLLELANRGVSDEDEASEIYPLPVLARVPLVPARSRRGPAGSRWYMPPEIREPYRTLSVQLDQRERASTVIMVTSPTTGDGKTTSAINLAVSLAAVGRRVVLLDFDLRKPEVGSELGIDDGKRVAEIVDPNVNLARLLVRPSELTTLRVLAGRFEPDDVHLTDGGNHRLPQLIQEARGLADYVVVDTPPLGEVSDALRLARAVDDILIVIRPGNSTRSGLSVIRELLDRSGYMPEGTIMIGADARPRGYRPYGYGQGYGVGGAPDLVLGDSAAGELEPAEPERRPRPAQPQRNY